MAPLKQRLTPLHLSWTEAGETDLHELARAAARRNGGDVTGPRRRLQVACEEDAIERGFPLVNTCTVRRAYHRLRENGDMP